jgi:disulfide oxidoreductase YuzD
MLIDNEKAEHKDGFAERIKSLEELLPLAKLTDDIVEDTDKFQQLMLI